MCAAYLLASTAVEVLSNPFPRDQLSSAFYSTLATFSRWMVNRCVLLTCAFTKITHSRVHDVLSNSQRLLRSFLGVPRSIPIHKLYKHTNVWNTYYIPFLPKKVNNICSVFTVISVYPFISFGAKSPLLLTV